MSEVLGTDRYKVVKIGSMFNSHAVRAGDGDRDIFTGNLNQCIKVSAALAAAFEDGKYVSRRG